MAICIRASGRMHFRMRHAWGYAFAHAVVCISESSARLQECPFADGKYEPPTHCDQSGCRSKSFVADRSTARTVDWQKLKVQELQVCVHGARMSAL